MDFLTDLLGYMFVISFIALMGMGYTNKIIIFYDKADYIRTLLLAICIVSVHFTMYEVVEPSIILQYIITPILIIAIIVLSSDCVIFSVKHNGNFFWGFVIAIYRLVYICLTLILAIYLAIPRKNQDGSINVSSTLFSWVLVGGVAYSSVLLINGSKVEKSVFNKKTDN